VFQRPISAETEKPLPPPPAHLHPWLLAASPATTGGSETIVQREEALILGLKRKTFYIAFTLVFALIIAAGVGAGVGVAVARSRAPLGVTRNDTSTSEAGGTAVFSTSKLTALSWTDVDGNAFQALFWQSRFAGSLMMSLWDATTRTWEVVNITDSAQRNGRLVNAGNGVSLAAAVKGAPATREEFRLFLAYTDSDGFIQGLNSLSPRGQVWGFDGLSDVPRPEQTSTGSQMSAWWPQCRSPLCDDVRLYYQARDLGVYTMRRNAWGADPIPVADNARPGSALAVTPASQDTDLDQLKLFHDNNSNLHEKALTARGDFGSNEDGTSPILSHSWYRHRVMRS
jgi:hypothetical protein